MCAQIKAVTCWATTITVFSKLLYDNTVNTVLKCVYEYTGGDNCVICDYIIFCLFYVDVKFCQGNAKSTNCISKFLLHYRKVSNIFEVKSPIEILDR